MRRSLTSPLTLGEIAAALGAELAGDPDASIDRLTSLRNADSRSISFLARPQQRDAALASNALAILVSPVLADALAGKPNRLIHANP